MITNYNNSSGNNLYRIELTNYFAYVSAPDMNSAYNELKAYLIYIEFPYDETDLELYKITKIGSPQHTIKTELFLEYGVYSNNSKKNDLCENYTRTSTMPSITDLDK